MNLNEALLPRINTIQTIIKGKNLDALLITNLSNIYYLTGFIGSSAVVIVSLNEIFLVTDGRYELESKKNCPSYVRVIIHSNLTLYDQIKYILKKASFKNIGYESTNLTVSNLIKLQDKNRYKLHAYKDIIEKLRCIKDKYELQIIKEANTLTNKIFMECLNFIRKGKTEIEISLFLEILARKNGCFTSFETIVASGINGSFPHAVPTNRRIKEGDFITIDFGIRYKNYCSDMTRTIAVGTQVNEKLLEIYNIVLNAKNSAIANINTKINFSQLDNIARKVISRENYGKYFIHSLGHGVGIDIHEYPYINSHNDMFVSNDIVITIEPGIYLPDIGGVRIEDAIHVNDNCAINLTEIDSELIHI